MDNPAAGSKKVPIPRPRKACTICRGLKTRCLPDGEDSNPTSRCSRCARLDLVCDYSRARKGRGSAARRESNNLNTSDGTGSDGRYRQSDKWNDPRLGSSVDARDLGPASGLMNGVSMNGVGVVGTVSPVGMGITSLPPVGHINDHMQLVRGWSTQQQGGASRTPITGKNVAPLLSRPGLSNPSSDHLPSVANGHHSQAIYARSTNSVESPHSRSRSAVSVTTLSNFFDPVLGFDDNRLSNESSHRSQAFYSTPVDAGIVTEQESRFLFDQFVQHLSTTLRLFDHRYHTYERLLELPVLLTAILSAASHYFRIDVSSHISQIAEQNVNHAISSGDHDIQLVQALIVLIVWLKPSDPTAYVKLGVMSRVLAQLRVEFPIQAATPFVNEEDERRSVDVERTIFVARGLDATYSRLLQLPPSTDSILPSSQRAEFWMEMHAHLDVPSDAHKAFLAGIWEFSSQFGPNPPKMTQWGWTESEKCLIDHLNKWINHPSMSGTIFASFTQIIGKTTLLNLRILGLQQRVATAISPVHLLTIADEIGLVIQDLAARDDLIYFSELHCAMLALPGLLLHKARSLFGVAELSRALEFCREVYQALERRNGAPEQPIAKVRHCYRRLHGAMDLLLRSATTPKTASSSHSAVTGHTSSALSSALPGVVGQQQQQQTAAWGVNWLWQGMPQFQS